MRAHHSSAARVCAVLLALSVSALAQAGQAVIDQSKIPLEANDGKDFVPPGWIIEEQVPGDLNNDSVPDLSLKLIQEKRAGGEEDTRQRALVILFKNKDGKLRRAAVADKLLQCPACGGAFYGAMEAPANVKVEKGVLIVTQDQGSRNVTEQTFRFRFDQAVNKFVLIGFDVTNSDRATGEVVKESTNFLTGRKITSRTPPGAGTSKVATKTTSQTVAKTQVSIEDVDSEKY